MSCYNCPVCPFDKVSNDVFYEIHVSVSNDFKFIGEAQSFKKRCNKINIKPVVALNDLGNKKYQIDTLTSTIVKEKPFVELQRIVDDLGDVGFNVIRQKIETVLWAPEVPSINNYIVLSESQYFEAHFKFLFDSVDQPFSNLAKRSHVNGELIHTIRAKSGSVEEFKSLISKETNTLDKVKSRFEFCMYDTNEKHDKEWMS